MQDRASNLFTDRSSLYGEESTLVQIRSDVEEHTRWSVYTWWYRVEFRGYIFGRPPRTRHVDWACEAGSGTAPTAASSLLPKAKDPSWNGCSPGARLVRQAPLSPRSKQIGRPRAGNFADLSFGINTPIGTKQPLPWRETQVIDQAIERIEQKVGATPHRQEFLQESLAETL